MCELWSVSGIHCFGRSANDDSSERLAVCWLWQRLPGSLPGQAEHINHAAEGAGAVGAIVCFSG